LISHVRQTKPLNRDNINVFLGDIQSARQDLDRWRETLPASYNSRSVIISSTERSENTDGYKFYSNTERLDYDAGSGRISSVNLIVGYVGHTMNLYRAAILYIFQSSRGFMDAQDPSEAEIW
jgi:hypothetical protein